MAGIRALLSVPVVPVVPLECIDQRRAQLVGTVYSQTPELGFWEYTVVLRPVVMALMHAFHIQFACRVQREVT